LNAPRSDRRWMECLIERVVSYTPEFRSCNFSADAKDLLQKVRHNDRYRISLLSILALSQTRLKPPRIYPQDQKAPLLFHNVRFLLVSFPHNNWYNLDIRDWQTMITQPRPLPWSPHFVPCEARHPHGIPHASVQEASDTEVSTCAASPSSSPEPNVAAPWAKVGVRRAYIRLCSLYRYRRP
jgi:hypothetical protein